MLFTKLVKISLTPIFVFLIVFIVYFGVGTKWTFVPPWGLDYFNPMAESLRHGRLNITSLGSTYDLSYYHGKWYGPWGILTALWLVPLQIIKGGHYVPLFYLSIFFGSLNVTVVNLLLKRLKKEFLPDLTSFSVILLTILFAFGTSHFYVSTLPSTWQAEQTITAFPAILGVYLIFKKKRTPLDYFLAFTATGLAALGRANVVLVSFLPISLFFFDFFKKKWSTRAFFVLSLLVFFSLIFFLYNYLRFQNPFENGYSYINEHPHFTQVRAKNGTWSLKNAKHKLRLMFLEIPKITMVNNRPNLEFNLEGNSLFFLTPSFLTIFLAWPTNLYLLSLWGTLFISLIPILMVYGTGWMQFGFRYSVDFLIIIFLLSVFGIKGRINFLYFLGIVFACLMQWWGINLLM